MQGETKLSKVTFAKFMKIKTISTSKLILTQVQYAFQHRQIKAVKPCTGNTTSQINHLYRDTKESTTIETKIPKFQIIFSYI